MGEAGGYQTFVDAEPLRVVVVGVGKLSFSGSTPFFCRYGWYRHYSEEPK